MLVGTVSITPEEGPFWRQEEQDDADVEDTILACIFVQILLACNTLSLHASRS